MPAAEGMEGLRLVVAHDGAVRIEVHARPRARTSQVAGVREGALVVQLSSPPVDGAANADLVETIADALTVPRRDVVLVRGQTSRTKLVQVRGLGVDEVRARLRRAMP